MVSGMLTGWLISSAACTASMIGVASISMILLNKAGVSKGACMPLASGFGQVAAAAVGSYFLVSYGFGRLFTLPLSWNLIPVWAVATAAAALTVAVSNSVLNEGLNAASMMESFKELYSVCRPCMFVLLLAVAPVCEEILFRGLAQEWIATVVGLWPAVAISTAVCTAGHIRALGFGKQLLSVAALAVILGVEVGVLGTLVPAMVTHAACNITGMRYALIYVRGDRSMSVCERGGGG